MKINRVFRDIGKFLKPNKVLVIYGPRQVGKTTLLTEFLSQTSLKYKLDSGDHIKTQHLLSSRDFDIIKEYARGYELIALDEAQNIPHVGEALKILVDQVPNLYVIATGSSSFELSGQVGEPLTGRKTTLSLYPIAQLELAMLYNHVELKNELIHYLVFGSYPEVVIATGKQEKIRVLEELYNSYLLKDILAMEGIKNSRKLVDLLKLLAFQVGSQVSFSELGQQMGMNSKTVARYLDLLEKTFIIFPRMGFSRNLRKELTRKNKYYFFDNGIRNALISNFNALDLRNDIGSLWENFVMVERLKKNAYQFIPGNHYFWRTWEKKEIDLIEEREGQLFAYEFKWKKKDSPPPRDWIENYPDSSYEIIHSENYLDFVL
ncbi:MAG: ATP-binding protein [Chlamydiae bacterium]|nr:ATP-binding protein [Chlamydiota bacterium]MBI3266752.1 ATP-binding protein [Chlamydiota bacterium]